MKYYLVFLICLYLVYGQFHGAGESADDSNGNGKQPPGAADSKAPNPPTRMKQPDGLHLPTPDPSPDNIGVGPDATKAPLHDARNPPGAEIPATAVPTRAFLQPGRGHIFGLVPTARPTSIFLNYPTRIPSDDEQHAPFDGNTHSNPDTVTPLTLAPIAGQNLGPTDFQGMGPKGIENSPSNPFSVPPPDITSNPGEDIPNGEIPNGNGGNAKRPTRGFVNKPPIESTRTQNPGEDNNNDNNNNNPGEQQGIIILPPNYEKPRGNTGLRNVFKPPPLKSQQNSNSNGNNDKNEVINNNGLPVGSLVAIVICSVIGVLVILVIGGFAVKYFVSHSTTSLIGGEGDADAYYQMI